MSSPTASPISQLLISELLDKLEAAVRADVPLKQLNHEVVNPLLRATKDVEGHAMLAEAHAPERLCVLLNSEKRTTQAAAAAMLSNMVTTGYSLEPQHGAQLRAALISLRSECVVRPDHERVFSTRCTRDRESGLTA